MPVLVIKDDIEQLSDDQLITIEVTCDLLAISRTSHWRHVKKGRLPQPVTIGQNSKRHRLGNIRAVARGEYIPDVEVTHD